MTFLCHGQSVFICVNPWQKFHRAGGIRTHDRLNPIQPTLTPYKISEDSVARVFESPWFDQTFDTRLAELG
jgi:hypothetical protein